LSVAITALVYFFDLVSDDSSLLMPSWIGFIKLVATVVRSLHQYCQHDTVTSNCIGGAGARFEGLNAFAARTSQSECLRLALSQVLSSNRGQVADAVFSESIECTAELWTDRDKRSRILAREASQEGRHHLGGPEAAYECHAKMT